MRTGIPRASRKWALALPTIVISLSMFAAVWFASLPAGPVLIPAGTIIPDRTPLEVRFEVSNPTGRVVGKWTSQGDGWVRFYPPDLAPGALTTVPCFVYRPGIGLADLSLPRGEYLMRWWGSGDVEILQPLKVVYPGDPSAIGAEGCDAS